MPTENLAGVISGLSDQDLIAVGEQCSWEELPDECAFMRVYQEAYPEKEKNPTSMGWIICLNIVRAVAKELGERFSLSVAENNR